MHELGDARKKLAPLLILVLLLPGLALPGLACQAVTRPFQPAPTQAQQVSQGQITRAVSPTPPPTLTWTPTVTRLPTLTPSPTSAPAQTPTLVVTPSAVQMRVFERLWLIVRDNYLYPDFNGLDWDAVHLEYRQKIEAGLTDDAFYAAMGEMIQRLGDDHSIFFSPEQARRTDTELAGKNSYVGIGVLEIVVPERSLITILLAFPSSPAEEAGLQSHDNILAVDGHPIIDETGVRRDLLAGPPGSKVVLTIQTPGQAPRQVEITRRELTESIPVPHAALTTPEGKRVGYLLLPTFEDDTITAKVKQALKDLSAQGHLDGIILDNRMNTGGTNIVARGVLSYFTRGNMGYFIDRSQHKQAFNVIGNDIQGSSRLPLVVLTGPDTISFGEIFSGVLQDGGRAFLIGERTAGNVELLFPFNFEDGSRVWLAHEAFHPRNHPQQIWEKTGVVPDQVVLSNWDQVTLQTDPVVNAALDHFDGN